MLQLKNITITHKKDLRELVQDVSFVLNPGDKAALIGEEGNGKSTLLKLIYKEEMIEPYAEYSGEIVRNGRRMGYLPQELPEILKEKQIQEYFFQTPEFWEKTPGELHELARTLGVDAGFFYRDQKINTLSGGEKVKMQLAGILLRQPEILLLDEPSNDLDIKALEWLEEFIRQTPLAVLYISHDETLMEKTASLIIHLEQIRRKQKARHTVAKMGYEQYVRERMGKFQRQAQLAQKERSEYGRQMERFHKIQQKVEYQQKVVSRQDPHGARLLKKKMHSVKSMEKRFEKQAEGFTEFPEAEKAIFAKFSPEIIIPPGKKVLDMQMEKLESADGQILSGHIRLCVKGPEKICITGRNGAGKTTFLRKISEILLARKDIRAAYMPQDYAEVLDMKKSPVEFLQKDDSREEIGRIRTYLGSMRYTADEMDHCIGSLSGGQKAKLLFLKMSMDGNDVLLLDEPTRNFSPLSHPVIRQLLKNFGGAVISVSHDRKYMREVCGKIYCLEREGLKLAARGDNE